MTWSGYSEQGTGSQERGPGRFTVDVPGVPTQQGSPQFVPVRAGGNMQTSGALTVAPRVPQDNTLTELAKMGQELLAPKIAAEKDRQFLEGMSRAATGVAVQEIMDEQSPLTKVFGDAPAVEGARVYTVAAKKASYVADVQNRMPELAKVSPDQLPAVIQQDIQGQLTGDPATDALLQRELLTAMPDLIRQHTKAAFLYQQGEADKAARTAMSATYAELSSIYRAAPGTVTLDQMDKAEQRLYEVLTPPPGVDEEKHKDRIADTLVTDLEAGNFDAARMVYDAGILAQIGTERAVKVEQAARRAAPRALQKAVSDPTLAAEVLAYLKTPQVTTEGRVAAWNAINDRVAGAARVPREYGQFFGENDLLRQGMSDIEAGQRAARGGGNSAQMAAASAEMQLRLVAGEVMKGAGPRSGSTAISYINSKYPNLSVKPAEVQQVMGAVFYELKDPPQQARLLNGFSGEKLEAAHDYLQQMYEGVTTRGASWEKQGPGFERLLQTWESLEPAARTQYFTESQRNMMELWSRKVKSGTPAETLFSTVSTMQRTNVNLAAEPDKDSIQAVVQEHLADALDNPLGADQTLEPKFSDEETARLTALLMGIAKTDGGYNIDPKRRGQYALTSALQRGDISIMGGRLYFNEDPDEAKAYELPGGSNQEYTGQVLDGLISEGLKAAGVEDDNRTVIRARGKPAKFIAIGKAPDGTDKFVVVTEAQLSQKLIEVPAARAKEKERANVWEAGRLRQRN